MKITGWVDSVINMPFISLTILSPSQKISKDVIVDTGFNGDLLLTQSIIDQMGLEFTGLISKMELANGSIAEVKFYFATIEWDNEIKDLLVGATSSEEPLLGTELLKEHLLEVDFANREVVIERRK